jgi:nitrate/nitrite transport system permease protein
MKALKLTTDYVLLPLLGIAGIVACWSLLSATVCPDLPSPMRTWEESKPYVLEPFAYRGELDQGVGRFTGLSLILVVKGYALALLVGTPLGFLLGSSKLFARMFDPIFQILRPVSPLAWLPLGYALFFATGSQVSENAALFAIAICSMWPTVLNTAVGVRAIPQDYLNVAKVLGLSKFTTLVRILIPATLPYMFTGFRLSLGIAWLVIVAAEMLTGRPGIGGFLWQEYNSAIYSHIILCILVIGVVGFVLDRLMGVVERHLDAIIGLPAALARRLRGARTSPAVASSAGASRPAGATASAAEGSVAHALS